MSIPRPAVQSAFERRDIARRAIELCATADGVAQEAFGCIDSNDARLFELIARRDEILQSLAEHLVSLRFEHHAADSVMLASSERVASEGDDLVDAVCAALDVSQRTTMALAARVATRVAELRSELAEVQRAGSVHTAYAPRQAPSQLDSRR